jgi:uncharacterized protein (DUF1684 family)
MKKTILIFILSFYVVLAQTSNEYTKEIKDWDANRVVRLKSETGWLNLAGLFWLDEEKNTFGTGKENKFVFPAGTITEKGGYFVREGSKVTLIANYKTDIKVNGVSAQEALVFHPDSSLVPTMSYGDLRWSIIQREDRIGVRLRNLKSENISHFKGIERFPIDINWRIKAKLIKDKKIKTIPISNVLGQTIQTKIAGKLIFSINNIEYQLDALDEDEELFVIFGDKTNVDETYPAGRFVYASKPDKLGFTYLDFNKAYNPPCAFTSFATCPLPPKQNILPIKITAGEKVFGH